MNEEELSKILKDHKLWVRTGGVKGKKANLQGAYLQEANLRGADLRGADLQGAYLRGADLQRAKLPSASIVPEVGPFYGFKKLQNGYIATLYIPRSAERVGGLVGRKCRASKVKVIKIEGNPNGAVGFSTHDYKTKYEEGKWIKPDKWDADIRLECTNGIHFFITRKEAEEY